MQSINTRDENVVLPDEPASVFVAGSVDDLPHGSSKTIALPSGRELALYNINGVNGEFYATENSCPHQGAPLAGGILCGHVVECDRHGWQFDVRTGECLTVPDKIETYQVVLEDGKIKILL